MVAAGFDRVAEADLASIVRAYSEVAERLKRSHELLHGEVVRLRDELHEKNQELARRERLAALGEMAAGVAHEIRNPLGGIGLYASLLEKDLWDRPVQADIVRRIRIGVRNLESVVGDILAFSGGCEPMRQRVPLLKVLDDALTQVAPQAQANNVAIEVNYGSLLANGRVNRPNNGVDQHCSGNGYELELFCDARQIERALLNLLFNALDAAGSGGRVWMRIETDLAAPAFLNVTIEDSGRGIPHEIMERIFNPFFTTKENGTGLGLAIVHRIAESHGGRVTAANRENGGARFVLSLPRTKQPVALETIGGCI